MQGDGDMVFLGLEMRLSPQALPQGYLHHAENIRLRRGYIEPRKGVWLAPWANKLGEDGPILMGQAHGGAVFKDPVTKFPWLIVAAGGKVYAGHFSRGPFEISVPPDLVLIDRVRFVQAFDGLLMFRGGGRKALIMKSLDSGFGYVEDVELEQDEDGQFIEQHLPSAEFGVYFGNRVFAPVDGDQVYASGVLTPTKGPVTLQPFRVNQGSDDDITAIAKFGKSSLLIGKGRSVYVVRNVYGDLSDIILDEFSSEYGIAGPDALVEVGSDLWFLATNRGIVSIRQTEQNEIQGNKEPISKPITPIINKIDWTRASRALATTFDSYVYFCLPVNDCGGKAWVMVVYDAQIGSWVSMDWGPWLEDPVEFMPLVFRGQQRLGMLNSAGYVVMLDDGHYDESLAGGLQKRAVSAVFRTRGYLGMAPGIKGFKRVDWLCETWDPHYDVYTDSGGASELCCARLGITKDRTKFQKPWNARPYQLTNKDDNQYAPHREDYSLNLSGGLKMCFGENGIRPEVYQEFNESARVNRDGAYLQVEVRTVSGVVRIKQITVGAQEASMGMATK
jgi:hypothetical protein